MKILIGIGKNLWNEYDSQYYAINLFKRISTLYLPDEIKLILKRMGKNFWKILYIVWSEARFLHKWYKPL